MDINENLLGYWPLNKGSGVVAFDESIYGNDGDVLGASPTWVDGKSGKCINFPGTDEQVDCKNPAPLNTIGNGSFWISFFMKSKDAIPLNYGMIFCKSHDDADNAFWLSSYGVDDRLNFYFRKGNVGISNTLFSIATTPFDTEFNHIALVVNRTIDRVLLYMNLVKDATEIDISSVPADGSNAGNVRWGRRVSGLPYEGLLDELRIYSGLPTLEKIKFLFDNPGGIAGKYYAADGVVELVEAQAVTRELDISHIVLNGTAIGSFDIVLGGVSMTLTTGAHGYSKTIPVDRKVDFLKLASGPAGATLHAFLKKK